MVSLMCGKKVKTTMVVDEKSSSIASVKGLKSVCLG